MKRGAIAAARFSIARTTCGVLVVAGLLTAIPALARAGAPDSTPLDDRLKEIVANHSCPCGCGSSLPAEDRPSSCFGCSVGKAEVSFIRESLAEGRSTIDIVLALGAPTLIEIFADYTDPLLAPTWNRARGIAAEFDQHRVVVRTPAINIEALRALELAECARQLHRFSPVRDALIEHTGPWDRESLLSLAEANGLTRDATRQCLGSVDVEHQISKDRRHASERGIDVFPAVSVNRVAVLNSAESIRSAVRKILLQKSF